MLTDDSEEINLEQLISTHTLPQRAKVTQGYDDPLNADNEFSTNDVIEVRRVICPFVNMTFSQPDTQSDVTISVPVSNPTRFRLPSNSAPRTFNTIRDVAAVWPYAVEARDEPRSIIVGDNGVSYRPAFRPGDVLRLVRLDHNLSGRQPVTLELNNMTNLELIRLPFEYCNVFVEVQDDAQLYTLRELTEVANVPRTLQLRHCDQTRNTGAAAGDGMAAWISGVPRNYDGLVHVAKPEYLVEIAVITNSDDEEESDDDGDVTVGAAAGADERYARKFLVSINTDITVTPCEATYICLTDQQFQLRQLAFKPADIFPRVVRVVSWEEETNALHNHIVRPGDLLILYQLESVSKLAARHGPKCYLLPIDHPSLFTYKNQRMQQDQQKQGLKLSEIVKKQRTYPFQIISEAGDYVNLADRALPKEIPLSVEKLIDERCVVVAKLSNGGHVNDAFHLPIRTRLTVRFERRWNKNRGVPKWSQADNFVEELQRAVYDRLKLPADQQIPPRIPVRPKHRREDRDVLCDDTVMDFSAGCDFDQASLPPPIPPRRPLHPLHSNTTTAFVHPRPQRAPPSPPRSPVSPATPRSRNRFPQTAPNVSSTQRRANGTQQHRRIDTAPAVASSGVNHQQRHDQSYLITDADWRRSPATHRQGR